jgi:hypothetical protein
MSTVGAHSKLLPSIWDSALQHVRKITKGTGATMKKELKGKLFGGFKNIYILLVFLFLYIPIIMVIIYSFNTSKMNILWEGFTLKWYGSFFHNRTLMDSLWISLWIAALSTAISTVIGTLGAVGLSKYKFRGKNVIDQLLYIPVGDGAQKDPVQAARWLERATRLEYVPAMIEFAIALFNGDGVPKDEARAAALFRQAALRGNPVAQNRYARILSTGRGIAQNSVDACA